jgi:hypothetical protein
MEGADVKDEVFFIHTMPMEQWERIAAVVRAALAWEAFEDEPDDLTYPEKTALWNAALVALTADDIEAVSE